MLCDAQFFTDEDWQQLNLVGEVVSAMSGRGIGYAYL